MSALSAVQSVPFDLGERIRARDSSAETELVQRFASGVRLLLETHDFDTPTARDLFQDIFRDVIQRLRRADLPLPTNLAGFIRQVVVHRAIAERSRLERHRRMHVVGVDLDAAFEGVEDPASTLSTEQVCEAVRAAVSSLPSERDRDVIRAHYLRGEDKGAICRRLGTTPAHFDVVLFRARQRLRALLVHVLGTERL